MGARILRESIREILLELSSLEPADKGDEVTLDRGDKRIPAVQDALADIVRSSYAPLGGAGDIESPEGLKSKFTNFLVSDVDEDPDPDAAIYYTDRGGSKKASASGSDGTAAGKSKLRDLMQSFYSQEGNWSEVSGAPANITIAKLGLPTVDSEAEVRALLGKIPKEDIEWNGKHPDPSITYGNGWYTRTIHGKRTTKIIVGKP
jgi:hypothetical protein